jgi:hypothetical protein
VQPVDDGFAVRRAPVELAELRLDPVQPPGQVCLPGVGPYLASVFWAGSVWAGSVWASATWARLVRAGSVWRGLQRLLLNTVLVNVVLIDAVLVDPGQKASPPSAAPARTGAGLCAGAEIVAT